VDRIGGRKQRVDDLSTYFASAAGVNTQSRIAELDLQDFHANCSFQNIPGVAAIILASQENLQTSDVAKLVTCWYERINA
jgi:hypothetical protein